MGKNRNRLPENTSILMPRLVCRDAAAEMDFCARTFDAEELNRRPAPDGTVAHGLLRIGGEMIMVEGEWPTLPSRAPNPDGTSPVVIFLYVPDVDATVDRAIANGARVLVPLQDQFWGDRIAWLMDPAGHVWTVASRIEETTAEERTARWTTILTEGSEPDGRANVRVPPLDGTASEAPLQTSGAPTAPAYHAEGEGHVQLGPAGGRGAHRARAARAMGPTQRRECAR